MTERTPLILPPIAQSQHASNSLPVNNFESVPVAADSSAEEPYTIKCICEYDDADTNTICCDKCESWQHYECYYDGDFAAASSDDFSHMCVDCDPRDLNRRRARELQRFRKDHLPVQGEVKKPRRPGAKTHKKKQSEAIVGDHDATPHRGSKSSLSSDLPQAKRAKTQHRAQNSISSQGVKRSPALHSRSNSHAHPLSPATTPPELPDDFVVHTYSPQFVNCWQNDPGSSDLKANLLTSLKVTSSMSTWLHSEDKLLDDTKHTFDEVFSKIKLDSNFAQYKWPKLQIVPRSINDGRTEAQIKTLTVAEPVSESTLLGELKGAVGFQIEYARDNSDSYSKLTHPAPFVFFHPKLPIYIDTRKEGSQCRYVRRSCRPNAALETLIADGQEYHFCFVADANLPSNSQITMPWEFVFPGKENERVRRILCLSDEGPENIDVAPEEYEQLTEMVYNVLSEYGGCACDLGHDCAFVRFHRNYQARQQAQAQPKKQKRPRKLKQQHVSPTSTGYATNSRDPSEGHRLASDAEDSVSHKRKDRHPEMLSSDVVSDRDKRKLAGIEKSFEQMDKLPPKKKKKSLDSSLHTATASATSQQRAKVKAPSRIAVPGSGMKKSRSRHQSESPATGISPKTLPVSNTKIEKAGIKPAKAQYTESGTQTDPERDVWHQPFQGARKKYRNFALTRFIMDIHRHDMDRFQRSKLPPPVAPEDARKMAIENGWIESDREPLKLFAPKAEDEPSPSVPVPIKDVLNPKHIHQSTVLPAQTAVSVAPAVASEVLQKRPPLFPEVSKPAGSTISISEPSPSADLKVQMPPPPQRPPTQSNGSTIIPPASSDQSPVLTESPVGISQASPCPAPPPAVAPPPVKKKLSLKDYNLLKKNASAHSASRTSTGESKPPATSTPLTTTLSAVSESRLNGDAASLPFKEEPLVNGDGDTIMGGMGIDPPPKSSEVAAKSDTSTL